MESLAAFHAPTRRWFADSFGQPTRAQSLGWPAISTGESTLILAPTGSGKTLAAFLWCIDRLMFAPVPERSRRCRAIYVSPLKALAVDVERNLRAPLQGIAHVAGEQDVPFHFPDVWIRTGDTPAAERARFARNPADILITTPESLYLLLTSRAREVLRSVETVIIDEIHALVPTKRGSHLALSLERLEALCERSPQRIGLSATQRPLDEVARFLGGAFRTDCALEPAREGDSEHHIDSAEVESSIGAAEPAPVFRPVTIVDTGEARRLEISVEVPVEDMARIGEVEEIPSGPAAQPEVRHSIWPAIHPRLLALVREHRSTLVFVNSRRLAERLAAALNELAGEPVARAHHGSLAREQRVEIEDALKSGRLPALIATSSLELGIDMGAIDLVIQIEAPPSIAAGMQRIGRASHQVGAVSGGVIIPKYRGDLVACAAVSDAMLSGRIEASRYPRNPLDVLAQQVVAMVAMEPWAVDELFATIRQAAPFAELRRSMFDAVLDMLSGVYPSDDFSELRPRINWDRIGGMVEARAGAQRLAVINGGTIPDRGLYGVFLAGGEGRSARVGELDEEMVFESREGETFVLGASTWRIEEIDWNRVMVSPAPGERGKMPFWKGEAAERPAEFGREIGGLLRELQEQPPADAQRRLRERHRLDDLASANLLQYLRDQKQSGSAIPDDRTLVIERCPDDLGDWRICVLSPFGGKVHAPWAMAVVARVREERGLDVEVMWSDDGFIVRFPESETMPDADLVIPDPETIRDLVVRQLASSSLFAARFRENAGRALLLPKRRPGSRTPLWQQRKRAADLLQAASKFSGFPILLETYRECLVDVFDLPALVDLAVRIRERAVRVEIVETATPSPFAGSLLFRYVANYIYDGDAPLAERRAQALAIDPAQLRELMGDVELRELLETEVIEQVEGEIQWRGERRIRHLDDLHDLLLHLGDLSLDEIRERGEAGIDAIVADLLESRRAIEIRLGGETRIIAAEDAARYRDGLGVPLPQGLPERLLEPVQDPLGDLILRYARTHGPFEARSVASRFRLGARVVEQILERLSLAGRLIEGEFRPDGTQREWCERSVLARIRRRSLARLRHQIEPAEPEVFGRFLAGWQGIGRPRTGLNALLDVVENLQGCPLPASDLETVILPSRLGSYRPSDLDTLMSAGEIAWAGIAPIGERDGRVALYLADDLPRLFQPPDPELAFSDLESRVLDFLSEEGASFFSAILAGIGGGFPDEVTDAVWSLVWRGMVTNDSFHPVRSRVRPARRQRTTGVGFRSRRRLPPTLEGRWSLVPVLEMSAAERGTAWSQQLLSRYGVLARESGDAEGLRGGFRTIYPVLRAMEESGRIRRGYFLAGVAAMQFALPGAVDRLRACRNSEGDPEVFSLASTDPANPWGSIFRWPDLPGSPSRSAGSRVVLVDGRLSAWISRGERQVLVDLPEAEPERSKTAVALAREFQRLVEEGERRALLIGEINGMPVAEHPLGEELRRVGFRPGVKGYLLRRTGDRSHA